MLAIAQHGQALAEAPHLGHPMRDEDDGDALCLQFGDQPAEPIDIGGGERGCWLIQQEHAGLAPNRLGDLDLLPCRQIEVADQAVGPDVLEAEAG